MEQNRCACTTAWIAGQHVCVRQMFLPGLRNGFSWLLEFRPTGIECAGASNQGYHYILGLPGWISDDFSVPIFIESFSSYFHIPGSDE